MERRRTDEARRVLQQLRDSDPDADIDREMDNTTQASKKEDSTRVRDLLSPKIRPLMIIGLGLACASCFVASPPSSTTPPRSWPTRG